MSAMICSRCRRTGIRWVGPMSRLTHTECPHCGGQNCQLEDVQDDACRECGETGCNGECYGDDMMGASS